MTRPDTPTHLTLYPHQRPPTPNTWNTWILKGGRDSGKTVAGTEFVMAHLRKFGKRARVGVMAPTQGDVIATCAEGPTGLWTLHRDEFTKYNRTSIVGGELWHRDGGYVRFLGSEKPARWNGPQWSLLWIDEAELCNPESITQADFGVRLGEHPQQVWTTTPKGARWVKKKQIEPGVVVVRASTYMNTGISRSVLERWEGRYAGTSLGKSQLLGLDLDVPEGACWPMLGERRDFYLKIPPEGLVWVRNGAGIDWGTTPQHLATIMSGSVDKTGPLWMRRAWGSASGSSKALIDALKEHRDALRLNFAAIDRSQWSLADWVNEAGVAAMKGTRDVEWRVGLVLSELEKERLFFDATDPAMVEAYDTLTQYHRDDDGEIVEQEDDYADALCYVVAEFVQPGTPFAGAVAGSVADHEKGHGGETVANPLAKAINRPYKPMAEPKYELKQIRGRPGYEATPLRGRNRD